MQSLVVVSILFLVIIVSFDERVHSVGEKVRSVDESAGQVQIVLLLGQPLLNDISVTVLSTDGLATGKHIINY